MTAQLRDSQQCWYIPVPKNKFPKPKFYLGQQVGLPGEDDLGNFYYDIGEIIGMKYLAYLGEDLTQANFRLHIQLSSYVKVGNPLQRHPHIHYPEFHWEFTGKELLAQGILRQELGGAELFISIERLSAAPMIRDVSGSFTLTPDPGINGFVPVYLSGRQIDDSQVWTSPLFVSF